MNVFVYSSVVETDRLGPFGAIFARVRINYLAPRVTADTVVRWSCMVPFWSM